MATVFISYATTDSKDVDQLEALLTEAERLVLRDKPSIANGEQISEAILKMLKDSQYFLLCYSKHCEKAAWVNWECGITTERAEKDKIKIKILRLYKTEPGAFLIQKKYDDLEVLMSHKSPEARKAAINQILSSRRRRIIRILSLRIAIMTCSLALLLATGYHLHTQAPAQVAWHQVTRKGDHIGKASNSSLKVGAYKWKRPSDSTLLLSIQCENLKDANKFFLSSETGLETDDGFIPLSGLVIDHQRMDFDGHKSLLLGQDLQKGQTLDMQLLFNSNNIPQNPKLHFAYRNSTYGLGRELVLSLNIESD